MAPTTLPGQITQTSPYGRDTSCVGFPVKVCEMLSQVDGASYLERVAVNNVKNIKAAKAAIKKAFQYQIEGKGFSMVEVLSTCPTNWGLLPGLKKICFLITLWEYTRINIRRKSK